MKRICMQTTSIANRVGNDQLLFNTYTLDDISSKPLNVCQSGKKLWRSPGWISGPAIYDHFILHYIIDGKGNYYCGKQQYALAGGDVFLIQPFTEVYYQADLEEPYRYYWVGFNGTECQNLLVQAGYGDTKLVVHCTQQEQIVETFESIVNIHSWSPAKQYYLIGLLYQLFGSLIYDNEQIGQRISRYYYDAVAYIRKNAHLPELNVAAVANHVGIDRTHLYRVFRDNSQYTVKEFITMTRIEKAKLFLTNTDHSIEQIAGFSGYADASHFTQIFRKIEGCTPSQYRYILLHPSVSQLQTRPASQKERIEQSK